MDSLKPLKLQKWETQGIKIHWSDGHISQYRSGWLRARCPCASCQEEANKPVAQPTGLNLWVANYYSARNPLRLSSLVILGVVARMFRCATRSSCWCT